MPDHGIVFFMPVYRDGWTPVAASHRRDRFVGVLFLGTHIADVVDMAVQATQLSSIPVQAFHFAWQQDVAGAWTKEMLYARPSSSQTNRAVLQTSAESATTLHTDLQVADATWQLQAIWHPGFAMARQDWLPWALALAGCLLTSLSFRYMLTLDRRRRSALERAATAEHHLGSQERSLKRIARMIDDVLWTLDAKDGKVRFVNSAVDDIFGQPAQAFYDHPSAWIKAVLPQDRARIFKARRELLAKGNAVFKMRLQRPDGSIRWIRVKAYRLGSDRWRETQISGIASDVTALTSATDSLRRSNRALHAIHTCDNLILSSCDEQSLLQGICRVIVENGYGLAGIGVPGEGERAAV
jgi:PAS domain S-box-containing protein